MPNFKPETEKVTKKNYFQEELQANLWSALEKIIPDPDHIYNEKLKLIKEKYSFISYENAQEEIGTLDDRIKNLFPNNIKGLTYTKDIPPEQCVFMKAMREDNVPVYAIIGVGTIFQFKADFLSPFYYEGSGGNHDFNSSEILENLYNAVTESSYFKKESN